MIHEGNNAVLLIATTYEEDTGTFTCRATTSAGTVETSAKLIVKSKNWIKDTDSIANMIREIGLILYISKNTAGDERILETVAWQAHLMHNTLLN